MIRAWFLPVILFAIFFAAFWNIKKLKWSMVKISLTALLCAILSSAATFGVLWIIITVFN